CERPRRRCSSAPAGAAAALLAWAWALLPHLLLAGNGLLGSLARAGVGMGALPVHGKTAAVANALVTADLDLALDVLGDVTPQVTLDLEVLVDVVAEPADLFVGEVTHPRVSVDAGGGAHLLRPRAADAEDVRQRDLQALFA